MNQQTGSAHTSSDGGALTLHTSTIRQNPTKSNMQDEYFTSGPDASTIAAGLTPQQEQAAALLASGKGVNEIADELKIHRSTVWAWRKLPTFEAYTNRLLQEIKHQARDGILSLYKDAIETFRRVLQSENGVASLKAATYIVERVQAMEIGQTDARAIVRQMCTTVEPNELDRMMAPTERFDEAAYRRICEELGIDSDAGKTDTGRGAMGGKRQHERR